MAEFESASRTLAQAYAERAAGRPESPDVVSSATRPSTTTLAEIEAAGQDRRDLSSLKSAKVTLDSIAAHFAAAGIARQETPARLEVVREPPRSSTGKILKQELRAITRAAHKEQAA